MFKVNLLSRLNYFEFISGDSRKEKNPKTWLKAAFLPFFLFWTWRKRKKWYFISCCWCLQILNSIPQLKILINYILIFKLKIKILFTWFNLILLASWSEFGPIRLDYTIHISKAVSNASLHSWIRLYIEITCRSPAPVASFVFSMNTS